MLLQEFISVISWGHHKGKLLVAWNIHSLSTWVGHLESRCCQSHVGDLGEDHLFHAFLTASRIVKHTWPSSSIHHLISVYIFTHTSSTVCVSGLLCILSEDISHTGLWAHPYHIPSFFTPFLSFAFLTIKFVWYVIIVTLSHLCDKCKGNFIFIIFFLYLKGFEKHI